jgi:hypothetical protein
LHKNEFFNQECTNGNCPDKGSRRMYKCEVCTIVLCYDCANKYSWINDWTCHQHWRGLKDSEKRKKP